MIDLSDEKPSTNFIDRTGSPRWSDVLSLWALQNGLIKDVKGRGYRPPWTPELQAKRDEADKRAFEKWKSDLWHRVQPIPQKPIVQQLRGFGSILGNK